MPPKEYWYDSHGNYHEDWKRAVEAERANEEAAGRSDCRAGFDERSGSSENDSDKNDSSKSSGK